MSHYRTPAEIERDIRETQAEMDSTVEALRRKLSPGELLGQTVDYLRDSGSGVGHTFMDQVRDKPLPLAVLTAGLAWLLFSEGGARRRAEISGRERFARVRHRELDETDFRTITQYGDCFRALANVRPRFEESGDEFANRLYPAIAQALGLTQESAEGPERFRQRVERAFDELSERAQDAQHKLSERAQAQWRRTREGARTAVETAARQVRYTGEQARHAGEVAARRARLTGERTAEIYHRYPLAVGALALAMGALLGAILPATRRERELLGETGQELRETAGAYAREAARAAGDVADRMARAARERAEREGLSPENIEERAAEVAERLRRTGEEAIKAGREEAERKLRGEYPGRSGTSTP